MFSFFFWCGFEGRSGRWHCAPCWVCVPPRARRSRPLCPADSPI